MQILERTTPLEKSAVVAIYDTHAEAEAAIRDLEKLGFDMTKLSIVGKDYHTEEDVIGYYTTGDRMRSWGTSGAFWGGIWGLLFGSAFFLIPGLGPILAAGPVVAWIRWGTGRGGNRRRRERVGRGAGEHRDSQRQRNFL